MSEITLNKLKNLLDDNELDLSAQNLEVVPKALFQLPKATVIDLSQNRIISIPPELCNMSRITKLDFGNNSIGVLPDNFGNLVNLQVLSLYNNQLQDLPLSFANLRNLKWLDLGKNDLEPELEKIAGNCNSDKECKLAATKVVEYMQNRKREIEKAKARQTDINQKLREAAMDSSELINKKANSKKSMKKNIQPESEKMSKPPASKPPKPQPKHSENPTERSRWSFFGFISSFIRFFIRWTLIVAACFTICASAALLWDCHQTGGSSIPNSRSFCADVTKMTKFKVPSEKFGQHLKNAYGMVFTGYKNQFSKLTENAQKSFNRYYKTSSYAKEIEKALYKGYEMVTSTAFKLFTLSGDAYSNMMKWYETDGKKSFGFITEPIQVGIQMIYEIAKDIFLIVAEVTGTFITRATNFIEHYFSIWAEKGFGAMIDAVFKH